MARIYQARTVRSILRDHDRAIRQNASASTFARSGLSVTAEGVTTVDGDLVVDGNFTATGKISNDALTDPLEAIVGHGDTANFSITTGANVDKLTLTIPVPAGFTQALVNATAVMNVLNTTAALDTCYLAAKINGASPGYSSSTDVGSSGLGSLSNAAVKLLTGLGSSFNITAAASTSLTTWPASTSNVINLDATVLFLR